MVGLLKNVYRFLLKQREHIFKLYKNSKSCLKSNDGLLKINIFGIKRQEKLKLYENCKSILKYMDFYQLGTHL